MITYQRQSVDRLVILSNASSLFFLFFSFESKMCENMQLFKEFNKLLVLHRARIILII